MWKILISILELLMKRGEANAVETEQLIYQQDCESFRYQDKLFWSRFQTMSIIEGAALGVILTNTLNGCAATILAFGTFITVGLICLLTLKDRNDGKAIRKEWKNLNGNIMRRK